MTYGVMDRLYKEWYNHVLGVYFTSDLVTRNPIFMNIPEPDPSVLIRPTSKWSVYIGKTEYGRPYYWDPELLSNPMIAVIGQPGAGKSYMMKSILIRMKKKGSNVPVFIVDPEDEYREVVSELGEGVVLNIGTDHYVNIFDRPYPNMSYQLWVSKTVVPGILKALKLSPKKAPLMVRILENAIFKVYESRGFHPARPETWSNPDPTLKDVVDYLEGELKQLEEEKGKAEIKRSTTLLAERLKRWAGGGEGRDFFAYPSTIPLRDLLKESIVVFNVKKLPEEARDLFTFYIFNFFYSLMEMLPPLPRFGIRLVLVFDEGWILLKRERGEEGELAKMFRRARKYGFLTIILTQQYQDVSKDILPLVGTVFILRIRDAAAVQKLAKSLNIPDRIAKAIPTMPTGRVVVAPSWRRTDFANASTPFVVNVEGELGVKTTLVFYRLRGGRDLLKGLRSIMASQ